MLVDTWQELLALQRVTRNLHEPEAIRSIQSSGAIDSLLPVWMGLVVIENEFKIEVVVHMRLVRLSW